MAAAETDEKAKEYGQGGDRPASSARRQ